MWRDALNLHAAQEVLREPESDLAVFRGARTYMQAQRESTLIPAEPFILQREGNGRVAGKCAAEWPSAKQSKQAAEYQEPHDRPADALNFPTSSLKIHVLIDL